MPRATKKTRSIRYHGNWCGPNWTAGQDKPTSAITPSDYRVPAVDDLDAACKDHDIDLFEADTSEEVAQANERFIEAAGREGIKGKAAALAVRVAGPSDPNLPASSNMPRSGKQRLRSRGAPYTTSPRLPDYEEVEAEDGADQLGRIVEVAQELDRQDDEDTAIRDELLRNREREFVIRADGQGYESPSFHDSTPSGQVEHYLDDEPMPHTVEEDNAPMDTDTNDNNGSAGGVQLMRANQPTLPGGGNRVNPSGYTTQIARMKPSYPFHQTTQAIMEHHGTVSTYLTKTNDGKYLKIRMNTYLQPYAESAGSLGAQPSWQPWVNNWSPQACGRYCMIQGGGPQIEALYHRYMGQIFDDPLFNASANFGDPVVAGRTYYESHYNAYTVTKVDWTVRVEMPFHAYTSNTTETAPSTAQVYGGIRYDSMNATTPPCMTAGRVFTHYQMSGDTIGSVNPPLDAHVLEMERWDNTYDNKVTVPVNGVRVIRGTWYPGKVKHNPVNDADIETWTPAGAVPGQGHLEHLVLQFREKANSNSANSMNFGVNISINLKYHVQWKELKSQIQYPKAAGVNPTGTVANSITLQGTTPYPI